MITLLFKLIFGLLGTLLSVAWWMVKTWLGIAIGFVIFILGLIFIL